MSNILIIFASIFPQEWGIAGSVVLEPMLTALVILVSAVFLYVVLRAFVLPWISRLAHWTRTQWDVILVQHGFFKCLAAMAPGVLAHFLATFLMGPDSEMVYPGNIVRLLATLWLMLFGMLSIHALLDGVVDICNTFPFSKQLPIRGFVQVIKLVTVIVFIVLSISMLLGKSPVLLISGMGALTAVLMLVFKDPILGFVAGIQLSANRMLSVGDWLEMGKYNANGAVIDVSLTTVKVKNWDQTITTIPTYALISDSFINWRGMNESGGRRLKRSLFIDMTSIRFLGPDDLERLRKAQLLSGYIQQKIVELERYNTENGVDPSSPVNGRKLTNIGTFRAYLNAYISAHPGINKNMIFMVRQLAPVAHGLPIEIYAFTSDTAWVAHEGVQADIFDHVIAVVPEFGLRVFQSPSSSDVRALEASLGVGLGEKPAQDPTSPVGLC